MAILFFWHPPICAADFEIPDPDKFHPNDTFSDETLRSLEYASYEEVYNAVYRNVKKLGEGGSFIFSGVHNLPATTPESHLQAMIDAYKAARTY